MNKTFYISLIILMCMAVRSYTQEISKKLSKNVDTTGKLQSDSLSSDIKKISLFKKKSKSDDVIVNDTIIPRKQRIPIKIAKDAPDVIINYGAQDTQWLEKASSRVHLYGDAYVKYEQYEIKAGYIIFDFKKNEAYAEGIKDSKGNDIAKPSFTDGKQNFTYNRLKYNFKTKKGIVYDAVTTEGEFFIHGATTKFISSESDSLLLDDEIYNKDALITTCNHDIPHYGIRTSKLKIIPDKIAVIGPANLEIAGVRTPIFLPFGFFPIATGTSNGLIFPQDYEYDARWGFGLREVGYYFPISDFIDLKLTGDIYTRGSFGLRVNSNYKKKYRYNGNIAIGYSDRREENFENGLIESQKSFSIRIKHNQDSKAHPYRKFNGSIEFETGNFNRINYTDAGSQLSNIYTSNMGYSYNFPDSPYSLRMGLSHRQNTNTKSIDISFPELKFSMNTTKPFANKNRGGNAEKWYEKITLNYNGEAKSFVKTTDSLIFTKEIFDDIQYGISHKANTGLSGNVLKYFTLSTNVKYEEIWFFRTLEKGIDPLIFDVDSTILDQTINGDTIFQLDTTFVTQEVFRNNFKPYRNVDISLRLSTQLFGTKNFTKGWLRGIRHLMKPSISLSYSPNTKARYENFYFDHVNEDLRESIEYNPLAGGVFGTPRLQKQSLSLNYGITNVFEAKYFSKKDSTTKKFKILNNLSISGSYNFAADSLKWSSLSISGNTKLLKGLTDFRFRATFDPYIRDANDKEINTTVWSVNKRPFQFRNFSSSFVTRLTFGQIRDIFRGKKPKEVDAVINNSNSRGREFDFTPENENDLEAETKEVIKDNKKDISEREINQTHILDLLQNFKINHTLNFVGNRLTTGKDSFYIRNNTISLVGSFDLTDNWNVEIQQITYDIKNKSLVYPSFTLSRDLHCWRMRFSWRPSVDSYSFFIGVQSNALSFVKYNYGQNNFRGR